MVLSARAPAISSAGEEAISSAEEEPDIPAALLRASCDLEILIPARDEVRRLPPRSCIRSGTWRRNPIRRLSW